MIEISHIPTLMTFDWDEIWLATHFYVNVPDQYPTHIHSNLDLKEKKNECLQCLSDILDRMKGM